MKFIIETGVYNSILGFDFKEPVEILNPIYSWCEKIDERTLEQLLDMSKIPQVHDHVCVMSDCHMGYGIPIGGVMPVKDIIFPYAVGNDIGCFTGNTKILLADGTTKTLKKQVDREFYIYSIDDNNRIFPGFARCVKTRNNANLVEVKISNGEKIRCTPDHLFKMKNGEYKEAQYLKPDDNLISFYLCHQKPKIGKNEIVISVKFIEKKEDVYCLQVNNKFHNFALASGVFVHNCGMSATKLSYLHEDLNPEIIDKIMSEINRVVPHGTGIGHRTKQEWYGFNEAPEFPNYIKAALETARYQLGSLGAGNHFVELLKGDDDRTWLMIHSGSRNLGANICKEFYIRAKNFCEESKLEVPCAHLSYLPLGSHEGQWYLDMMDFALDFAKENRRRMMNVCESISCGMLGCTVEQQIDIHHNYASFERHYGEEVLVHRKGATPAFKDQLGIIPGSMGTSSYIVKGKGNKESFCTVSHGAGRAMSRTEAKKRFKESETKELLKGIWFNRLALDEDPRCYKDINEVIKAQSDLVEPIVRLEPLGVIIGTK